MEAEIHALAGAYVCHALDAHEEAAFEAHLAQCPFCSAEVAELTETVALLGLGAAVDPPMSLRQAVYEQIAITRQAPPLVAFPTERRFWKRGRTQAPHSASPQRPPARPRNRPALAGWAVAVALALFAGGLTVHTISQQHSIDSARAQADTFTALLAAPDSRVGAGQVSTGGMVVVTASRTRDEAAIALTGLVPPPAGHAYQLWIIGPGGTRSGGVVPTDSRGTAGPLVTRGLGDARTVGLTLEPIGGSTQPTTTPLILLPMPV